MVALSANIGQFLAMDLAAKSQTVLLAILLGGGVIFVTDSLMFKRSDKKKAAKAALEDAMQQVQETYETVFIAHNVSIEDHAHYSMRAKDLAGLINKMEAKQ